MEPAKLNIKKQIAFWRESAAEDWNVGRDLVRRGEKLRLAQAVYEWLRNQF